MTLLTFDAQVQIGITLCCLYAVYLLKRLSQYRGKFELDKNLVASMRRTRSSIWGRCRRNISLAFVQMNDIPKKLSKVLLRAVPPRKFQLKQMLRAFAFTLEW